MDANRRQPAGELRDAIIRRLRDRNIPEYTSQQLEKAVGLPGGSSGVKSICHWRRLSSGQPIAVKCLSRSLEHLVADSQEYDEEKRKRLFQYFERECALWYSGSRESEDSRYSKIVRLLGFAITYDNSIFPSLVLELYPDGDLRSFVTNGNTLGDREKLLLLKDVASGLAYLHEPHLMIVHRDIKGSNIMVRRRRGGGFSAAIGDFGSARLSDPQVFPILNSSTTPSLAWTPPEYLANGRLDYSNPTIFGDIWSFACTVIEIMSGADPWDGVNDVPRCLAREKSPHHPPSPKRLMADPLFRSFTRPCFLPMPEERPTGRILEKQVQKLCEEH